MKPTNKGIRNEITKRKHKRRCENLGVEPENNYCYKAQGKPCSCFLCSNKKYKRKKYKTDIDIIDAKFYNLDKKLNNLYENLNEKP